MREIDKFFSSRVDKTLYHYTGIGGLLGIVESNSIWASHAYYLNDTREILYACEVLASVLSGTNGDFDEIEQDFLQQFLKWLSTFKQNAFHIYIFSLSEVDSLLSQWRSYTPHGKGVSLGFSADCINRILLKEGFRIAKCLYQRDEHIQLLESLREMMLATFRQRVAEIDTRRSHPSQKYFEFLEEFRGVLLQVLAIIKHPAFSEESEWRVISPYYPKYTVPEIKFREGASMLMPYIEIKLADGEKKEIFDEVLLGPSRDVNLSMSALGSYLSNKKACRKTSNSRIPFRKWEST